MTRDQVKAILDEVPSWPPERQADVAHVVEVMEEQDMSVTFEPAARDELDWIL
jgi:hypothetical protein